MSIKLRLALLLGLLLIGCGGAQLALGILERRERPEMVERERHARTLLLNHTIDATSRAALNQTIHDVRNFLIGLEPEVLKLHTFAHSVASLPETMHGIRPFRSRVEIDEALAGSLTLAHCVGALQVTRAAVSNALRHGAATWIAVSLRCQDGVTELEVTDDGHSFDASAASPGKGHGNFVERAQELVARLTVDSQPGRGTRVRLTFNPPNL